MAMAPRTPKRRHQAASGAAINAAVQERRRGRQLDREFVKTMTRAVKASRAAETSQDELRQVAERWLKAESD